MNLALWPKKKTQDSTLKNEKFKVKSKKGSGSVLKFLQELGKALQFPIAVLPFAAVLNRFGQLGITYTSVTTDGVLTITNQIGYWVSFIIQQPGAIVFANLPLLFAIGVAFGFADDHRGEVALVGAIFYLIMSALTGENALPGMMYGNVLTFKNATGDVFSRLIYVPIYGEDGTTISSASYVLNIGVLGGIVAGVLSAKLYNKYKGIKLPQALSFFGGRRFVPMIALIATIPVGFLFAVIWPWMQFVLMEFGKLVANPNNPAVAIPGITVYGVLNRLLLPFGLHQILNTFFWFQLPINGEIISPITGIGTGRSEWVNGDINAFTSGIAGSGLFQSGFFPMMMGGVPAIAIAMILTANKDRRKNVAGFLGGAALVSLVSGITEPIEFSFAFISPLLFVIHAILTGAIITITTAMHIQVGFGFSAGLIDYLVSFAQSWGFAAHNSGATQILANPLWILLLTAIAGVLYFVIFYTLIIKLNIQTPGRENVNFSENINSASKEDVSLLDKTITKKMNNKSEKYSLLATNIIAAIGSENFVSVDNCATRLRLVVKDTSNINSAQIKAAGAFGIVILTKETLQIIIGLDVEHVANIMKEQLKL